MSTFRTPAGLMAMIRRVHSPRGRQQAGLYSIEGTRLLERALRAGAPLVAVLAAESLAHSAAPRHRALIADMAAAGCPLTVVADEKVYELTEGRDLGPILGLVRLPPVKTLAEVVTAATQRQTASNEAALLPRSPSPPLFLAALDIVDPGNIGALTRTAHAAGGAALLAVGASDPFHPRATRISRGSIFRLPVIYYPTTAEMLDDLGRGGVVTVGAVAAGGAPLPAFAWPRRPVAVLMGNEAEGLPAEVAAAVDYAVTIPMAAGVDSYSVNAAAAIICFARQWTAPAGMDDPDDPAQPSLSSRH